MEEKRSRTSIASSGSWSEQNVPLEVWFEILSYLPVKSLVRLRCVSKSWGLIIRDPEFCHLHRDRFNNNNTDVLYVHQSRYGFIRSGETFETIGRLCNSDTSNYNREDYWWSISCISDGLILLNPQSATTNELLLWNPSIRKGRKLPLPGKTIILGLGFDPLIMDYKVVLIRRTQLPIAIYSIRTNSWEAARFQARGSRCSENESWWKVISKSGRSTWRSLSLMGCLYFITTRPATGTSCRGKLVSFHLKEMVFTFANLPPPDYCDINNSLRESLVLVDGGCALAVCQSSMNGPDHNIPTFSLWTIETSSSSDAMSLRWSKRYSIFSSRLVDNYTLYHKKSGDMVYRESTRPSELRLCNVQTRATKILPKKVVGDVRGVTHVCSYKESLVLIDDKDVDAPTFSKIIKRLLE